METKHVINIAGTTCPPESDREFNKWYDETHIPINLKFKGLMEVTRYQLVRFTDYAVVKKYPRYITPYKFKDLATFTAWNHSRALMEAAEGSAELFARLSVDFVWRVQYESIKTWENTSPLSVITLVGTQCPPETAGRFDQWYSEKHIPDLLKFKGLQGATRFQLASSVSRAIKGKSRIPLAQNKEYPQYLTFYYFKDIPTADAYDTSPERVATHEEWLEVVKETGVSVLWRAQYKPMRNWQR